MKPVVLVVEDEEINIEYIANLLEKKYDVKVAFNGQQAVKILESVIVDLVLLDIKMPKMDGFEVAKYITSDSKLKNIPFIFLTASNDQDSIVKGFELGAKDYITKPFNKAELVVRVANHIRTHLLQLELKASMEEIRSQQQMLIQQSKLSAMGEMTSMLAHQWRQPLNAISVLLQEIQIKKSMNLLSDEEFDTVSDKIKSKLEYMSKTIDDFRDFFKPNKDKKEFNLIDAVNSAYNITQIKLDSLYIQHSVDIKSGLDKEYFTLSSYEGEFKQVIINLINNAVDAIEENTDSTEPRYINTLLDAKEDTIIIKITDSGKGIPEDMKEKIFEPYSSTKLEQNGSGLGLYMSKMIIEKNMGGTISAVNAGEGACFTIMINKEL